MFCSHRHISPKLNIIILPIYIHRTAINPTFFKSQNPNSIWFLFSAIHSSPGSYFFFFFYTLHLQSNFDILPNSTIFIVYRSSCTGRSKTNQFVYTREIHDFFFLYLFYINSTSLILNFGAQKRRDAYEASYKEHRCVSSRRGSLASENSIWSTW